MKTTLKLKISNPHKMRRLNLITSISRLPSKLINKQSIDINVPPTHLQPTPPGGENFLARFCTFTIFFKNVLEYRNRSKFVRGPNSTYSTIWEKNIWGSGKKVSFLILRPQFLIIWVDRIRLSHKLWAILVF